MRICLLLATYKICNSLTANSTVKSYVTAQRFFSKSYIIVLGLQVLLFTCIHYGEYTVATKPIKGFLISRKKQLIYLFTWKWNGDWRWKGDWSWKEDWRRKGD